MDGVGENLVVMKFGGGVLRDAESFKRAAAIVKTRLPECVVVVSALNGVTDRLIDALKCKSDESVSTDLKQILAQHETLVECLANHAAVKAALKEKVKLLERMLYGICFVGEATPRTRDFVESFGERLSAIVFTGFLEEAGIPAKAFDAENAGIITDGNYGKARPLTEKTTENLSKTLGNVIGKQVPVVTGFYGVDEKNNPTTFGRGGSDYSAGLLAGCLDAARLEVWKDVNGFMSADPKLVPNAALIHELSFEEAQELGHFGAKILHPSTVIPLRDKEIPVHVKNVFDPDHEGTVISGKANGAPDVIKSVASKKDAAIILVKGMQRVSSPSLAATVFDAMNDAGVGVDAISTSQVNFSFIVTKNELQKAVEALKTISEVQEVDFDDNVSFIGVVGKGMVHSKGVASRVFGCLAKADVNIIMISQGASEINISFAVKKDDMEKAVKAVHREFLGD